MKTQSSSFQTSIQIVLLLLATLALYSVTLSAPFVFDDIEFFEATETLSRLAHTYFSLNLRWLSYSSLGRTVAWFGPGTFCLKLGNVLLHGANAIALFFLLRKLFRLTLEKDGSTSPQLTWFAFFGALLFALHPVAVYGAAYIIQRSILMATLFTLLMLLAYLQGLVHNTLRWMVVAALCYFAAVYSKEHSIAAPGVALALTFLVRQPSTILLKKIAPFYLMTALIAVTVLLGAKGIIGQSYEPNAPGMLNLSAKTQGLADLPNVHLLSILTQSALFFKYLGLWLLPNPAWMSVDMREPFAMSFMSWPHLLGLLAFLAYPCVAAWLLLKRGSKGLLGFGLLFPWIFFVTEFSAVRIQEPFVLYRSYLWMPGLFAAIPFVFGRIAAKKSFILLGLVSLLLIPLALNRLNTFSSPYLLWDDAEKLVRNRPRMFGVERIYYNRGTELGKLKRYREAIADFDRTIEIFSFDLVYGNRATAYYFIGEYRKALEDYNHAIALNPNNPTSYYGRALANNMLGNFVAAQEDAKKSCSLGLCP